MMSRIGSKKGPGESPRPYTLHPRPVRCGFTLVEVILTVAILSFGLIGILRAYMVSITALEAAQETVEAFCLLKNQMAEIELREKQERALETEISYGRFEDGFSNYQWELKIQSLPQIKLNEAVMTVYRDGHTRRHTAVTYVYQKK